jgi:hypothetical protein
MIFHDKKAANSGGETPPQPAGTLGREGGKYSALYTPGEPPIIPDSVKAGVNQFIERLNFERLTSALGGGRAGPSS